MGVVSAKHQKASWVTLDDGVPRYFRTFGDGGEGPDIPGPNVGGLMDLYCMVSDGTAERCVEVGCASGESSEIAAQFFKSLWCVDPWGQGFETNEAPFKERTKRFTNITVIKQPSAQAAIPFEDSSLDMVYIDAMHDYDNVRQDILAWLPKVRRDGQGWIGGHDYNGIETHVGVVQAVDELLGKPELRFADSSWLFPVPKQGAT